MNNNSEQQNVSEKAFEVTHRLVFSIAVPMSLAFLTTPLLGIVDTAVVGQFANAALIGGLAIGAIIFDLIFGTFNFLRSATTGLVAQAVGRHDQLEEQAVFLRSLSIAFCLGLILLLFHPFIISAGIYLMDASAQVAEAASKYFAIRIFSAPAALMNYALLGYVLGQGKGRTGLILQIFINGTNIVLSFILGLHFGLGLEGVALATVIAEYSGILVGLIMVFASLKGNQRPSILRIFNASAFIKLMALNGDIMIRSLALIACFAWFTRMGSQLGDNELAANAILLNFFMISGYLLDGFATAAEQLTGRSIGANYRPAFSQTLRLTLLWGFIIAGVITLFMLVFGPYLIDLMTREENVRFLAKEYYLWAAIISLTGVLAFQMDGIFIGATWSSEMRNMMLVSLVTFGASTLILTPLIGNHGLWLSLNLFVLVRGFLLSAVLPTKMRQTFTNA